MTRAVALFSGGLDSMLAVRILQRQGLEIEALNVRTVFECCAMPAASAAAKLGVRLHTVSVGDDYLDVIRRPAYGYGKGVNPCVDCRIYMARLARRWMEELDAQLVVSGEVLGQREMSQKRLDLDLIANRSGLEGRLLRPLSAKLLAPTIAEREGLVNREQFYSFTGRGRRGLIELARRLGIDSIPGPSSGCRLAEVAFAPRVRDLLSHRPEGNRWEFELLNVGRHLRVDPQTKIVLGRNAEQNAQVEQFFERSDCQASALLIPESFRGPHAMILGELSDRILTTAGALMLHFARQAAPHRAQIRHRGSSEMELVELQPDPAFAALAEQASI